MYLRYGRRVSAINFKTHTKNMQVTLSVGRRTHSEAI